MRPEQNQPETLLHQSIVYSCATFSIGRFRCPPDSSLWQIENVCGHQPTIVFPRTAVRIQQAHRDSVIASPNHVMFYNAGQPYFRSLISHRGDVCEYFRLSDRLINDALQSALLGERDRPHEPFEFSHGPCSPQLYMLQRSLFLYATSHDDPDPMLLQEKFMSLISNAIGQGIGFNRSKACDSRFNSSHREKVEAAKEFATLNYCSNISLEDIARQAQCSVFHLCRIFKQSTGISIHQFVSQLRIRTALEEVLETDRCLTEVALDYGYSSHSHFTNAFRAIYGCPPSRVRDAAPELLSRNFSLN